MKLVLVYQNMVHLPKTSKDIKRLIESADDSIVGEYEQTNRMLHCVCYKHLIVCYSQIRKST